MASVMDWEETYGGTRLFEYPRIYHTPYSIYNTPYPI
jgi:hypothetical protein